MKKVKKIVKRKSGGQFLHELFYDLLNNAGISVNPLHIEIVRNSAKNIEDVIKAEIKLQVIEYLRRFQDIVLENFLNLDTKIDELNKRLDKIENNSDNYIGSKEKPEL